MHIYKITNLINGKVYIGQTMQKNPKRRWYEHCAEVKGSRNSHLYNSMRLHGVENFSWEVIDTAKTLEQLNDKERFWLEHYRALTECYNVREAGSNRRHSPESIERMREAQRAAHARRRAHGTEGGWTRSDGGAMKGKEHSPETKKKMSESAKRRGITPEAASRKNYRIGKVCIVDNGRKKWVEPA